MPQMEVQPFEHYDYVMLMFRNDQDFQQACELLGIEKVQIEYPRAAEDRHRAVHRRGEGDCDTYKGDQ